MFNKNGSIMFGGLRQNSIFYILEKNEDGLAVKIGQVMSVSNQQSRYGQYSPTNNYSAQQELFVDIKVKVDEEVIEFKQLNASHNIANSGNVVVSDSREAINSEVDGLVRCSQQHIDAMPYHNKIIKSSEDVKRIINPQFAKEKEQEEKIGALEEKMGSIEGTLQDMMGMLSKALSKGVSKKMED